MSLMDLVSQQLGSEQVSKLASHVGASNEQTENAIGMALPTLIAALAKKADDDGGVDEIESSLSEQDDHMLDNVASAISGGGGEVQNIQALGGGLLGNILGGRQGNVESGIGKAAGLSGGQVSSLLAMLAPMVMGALSQKKKESGSDLGGMLKGEKQAIEKQATGGLLAGLLDQDGGGDFDVSDVMKIGMSKVFGK